MRDHPLEQIPARRRRLVFLTLLTATLLVGAALQVIDQPLRTHVAPSGIVSFEMARTVEATQLILDAWSEPSKTAAAGLSLGLDFLFMPLYSTTIALACVVVARRQERRLGWLDAGRLLAFAQWGAAVLDAAENVALISMLMTSTAASPATGIAFWSASVKFVLIGFGLTYSAIGRLLPARPSATSPFTVSNSNG